MNLQLLPFRMRIFFLQIISALSIGISSPLAIAHADNDIAKAPVRSWLPNLDQDYLVRFSTTIPAGTAVQLVSTHTVDTSSWPSGITHSTAPSNTAGGAAYIFFQVQGTTTKVWYDFNPASLSTSTLQSPSIANNGYFPPTNFPFSFQNSIWVKSDTTATITGYIIFNRSWNR